MEILLGVLIMFVVGIIAALIAIRMHYKLDFVAQLTGR